MSMVLTKEDVANIRDGVTVSGVVWLTSSEIRPAKNGVYWNGECMCGCKLTLKAFNGMPVTNLMQEHGSEYVDGPVLITGYGNIFNGAVSVKMDSIRRCSPLEYPVELFLEVKYNAEAYWNGLKEQFARGASEKIMKIANATLFENEEVAKLFKLTPAASTHHDNCMSGLLAHTFKVLRFVDFILATYPDILGGDADKKDCLRYSALVHDIGKIKEMNYAGVYAYESIVTHRYLGIEMLPKDMIIEAYDNDFWLEVVAVLLQHHGEFGDDCRTMLSYIVHKADLIEAKITELNQADKSSGRVKIDDLWLTVGRV